MRVAVLCEFSGVVRDAFLRLGHDAISCDLLPTDAPGPHVQGDCLEYDWSEYDLAICHPPCTYLAVSGARWWKDAKIDQWAALNFVRELFDLPVKRIALENPIGVIGKKIRKCDQIIQPWQFGHGCVKATCLWLKDLPKLNPTQVVSGRYAECHRAPPSDSRWKDRSRTYPGIAAAMAEQWGGL